MPTVLTSAVFEYGLTLEYGSEVNATPISISGNANEPVVASVSGLASNTTYHFRLKAFSAEVFLMGRTCRLPPNL